MAAAGPKPKPAGLRLIDGTHRTTRHGSADQVKQDLEQATKDLGKPIMPAGMKGEAAKAWKRYVDPVWWLDRSKEGAAIAFCELWQEFRFAPVSFPAAKHGQLRAYMAELGFTDERNRKPAENAKDENDFF